MVDRLHVYSALLVFPPLNVLYKSPINTHAHTLMAGGRLYKAPSCSSGTNAHAHTLMEKSLGSLSYPVTVHHTDWAQLVPVSVRVRRLSQHHKKSIGNSLATSCSCLLCKHGRTENNRIDCFKKKFEFEYCYARSDILFIYSFFVFLSGYMDVNH